MGAVRVKAKLTNAADESLARRGMLPSHEIRTCEVDALVDTGAVRTVLPQEIVARLGLAIDGQLVAQCADGRTESVNLTEPVRVELAGRNTAEEALVLGDEVVDESASSARPTTLLPAIHRGLGVLAPLVHHQGHGRRTAFPGHLAATPASRGVEYLGAVRAPVRLDGQRAT
jgi:hypothetical protein